MAQTFQDRGSTGLGEGAVLAITGVPLTDILVAKC